MIEFHYRQSPSYIEIRYLVTQKFWLRLMPQLPEQVVDRELITGDEAIDSRFVIHADQPEAAIQFLAEPAVRETLVALSQFDRLEIYKGQMRFVLLEPLEKGWKPSEMDRAFLSLARLMNFYDDQRLPVAISSPRNAGICPYCRETLQSASKGAVVFCVSCDVRHHLECWTENKQCTTWGCRSTNYQISPTIQA